jgi:hypothetical protein
MPRGTRKLATFEEMISFLKVPGGAETAFGQSEAQGPLCGAVVLNCALVTSRPGSTACRSSPDRQERQVLPVVGRISL